MCHQLDLDLGADLPTSLGDSRKAVRAAIADYYNRPGIGDVAADAELIVSELVTNSIRAQASTIRLQLDLHASCLDILVFDDAAGMPKAAHAPSTATHGRGLAIVVALSQTCQVSVRAEGKEVLARVKVPDRCTDRACKPDWDRRLR